MARTIEVTLPPRLTPSVLAALDDAQGIVRVVMANGASIKPPGDVVTIEVINDHTRALLAKLQELDVLNAGNIRITTPDVVLSKSFARDLLNESNETTWEEVDTQMRTQVKLAGNFLTLMFVSGALSVVGLYTNLVLFLIAAQLLAPALEPLLLMPFGVVCGSWTDIIEGLKTTAGGYLAVVAGGAFTQFVLSNIEPRNTDTIADQPLVHLFGQVSFGSSIYATVFGAIAAAIIVSALRSVLASGVNVALALIPGASLTGAWLVAGKPGLAGYAALNWLIAAGGVVLVGGVVFAIKQSYKHRRRVVSLT